MMREYEALQAKYERLLEECAKLRREVAQLRKLVETEEETGCYRVFVDHQGLLTPTERVIYDLYVEGNNTVQVRQILGITENTLKYHNRNLYSKLGVSSRRQLVEFAKRLEETA